MSKYTDTHKCEDCRYFQRKTPREGVCCRWQKYRVVDGFRGACASFERDAAEAPYPTGSEGRKARDIDRLNLQLADNGDCWANPDGRHLEPASREVDEDGLLHYGFPLLEPRDVEPSRMVAFTDCARMEDAEACVHFFLADFRFEGVWSDPLRYVSMLSRFGSVLTPDFSLWLDMPDAMLRWQVYRARAVGAAWEDAGLAVVPTLTWCDWPSLEWCFDGLPTHSTVALSTVGLMGDDAGKALFEEGAGEACRKLEPSRVLAFGTPHGFDANGAEVVWYESGMQARFRKMREAKKSGRKESDDGTR